MDFWQNFTFFCNRTFEIHISFQIKIVVESENLQNTANLWALCYSKNIFSLFLYERGMDDRLVTKDTLVQRSGIKKDMRRRVVFLPKERKRLF